MDRGSVGSGVVGDTPDLRALLKAPDPTVALSGPNRVILGMASQTPKSSICWTPFLLIPPPPSALGALGNGTWDWH